MTTTVGPLTQCPRASHENRSEGSEVATRTRALVSRMPPLRLGLRRQAQRWDVAGNGAHDAHGFEGVRLTSRGEELGEGDGREEARETLPTCKGEGLMIGECICGRVCLPAARIPDF